MIDTKKIDMQHDELRFVCRKISECAKLVKLCDAMLLDNRGVSSNPNYISIPEIRIVCGLSPNANIKRGGSDGYKVKLSNGIVYVEDPQGRQHSMPLDQLRKQAADNRNVKSFTSGGILNNPGSVNKTVLKEAENVPALVRIATNITQTMIMITNVINGLWSIKSGFNNTVKSAKEAGDDLKGVMEKLKTVKNSVDKTRYNAERQATMKEFTKNR